MKSLVWFGALATLSACLGCKEAASETAPPAHVAAPSVAAPSVPAAVSSAKGAEAPSAGQTKFDEEAFEVHIEAPATVKLGEAVLVVVSVNAKSGYKVNQEYPLKFTFEESSAVKPELPVLRKEQASVEKTSATLKGKVTLSAPGPQKIGGKLSFSVCTAERCLIEKRDLSLSVTAS